MTERDCNACLWARRDGDCASWDCDYIPMAEAAEAWKEAKASEMTEEETKALNDLYARALDPEWQRAHRAMGFSSPIADLYDTLEELAKERSEDDDLPKEERQVREEPD